MVLSTVDRKRVKLLLQACSGVLSNSQPDYVEELSDRGKAIYVVNRCRQERNFATSALLEIFLHDMKNELVPKELKITVVQEACRNGVPHIATPLALCTALTVNDDVGEPFPLPPYCYRGN